MIKKLVAIGNSYGLVIDKSILEILKLSPNDELELSTDGTRLIIEPVRLLPAPVPEGMPQLTPPAPRRVPRAPTRPEPRHRFPKKQPW